MNIQNLRTLFVLLLTVFIYPVYAQQGIGVSGKVTALEDGKPIHRASVSIDKKGIGTATNTAGQFALIIPASNLKDSVKVSCIGYKTQKLPIDTMKDGSELNVVLEKNEAELATVNITYYEPMKIIQKAIDRIRDNYLNHPHILRGFYRMYTFNKEAPLQLSEAVFDVYNFGYADKRADLFKLIKARNEKNERDFNYLEFNQKPNTIFEDDVVNHIYSCGFLNDAGLQLHQYEVTGVVDMKGYKAYQVEFREKPGQEEEKTYRGRMYIDTKTYAFIYFEFGLSPPGLKYQGSGNYSDKLLTRLANIDVGMVQDSSKVSYQEVGNKWVLAGVEGDDSMTIKSPELNYDYVAHVKFNYQITAVDTTEKSAFSEKIGRGDSINAYKSNGDERFWKDYNILLSDYDTEGIFKQVQEINKVAKGKGK